MIATLLAAAGFIRRTNVNPPRVRMRRARWRGSDGQWQWAAV